MSTLLSSRTFERVPAKTTAIITVRVRDAVQADNVIELTVRWQRTVYEGHSVKVTKVVF
ncbi:MAG: hypothetical protein ABSD89_05765 [Halobacteriota archaeon]